MVSHAEDKSASNLEEERDVNEAVSCLSPLSFQP